MPYQTKLARARQIIEAHFAAVEQTLDGTASTDKLKDEYWASFTHKLLCLGGTSEDALSLLTWEDLQKGCDLPLLVAKQVAAIFRAKEDGAPETKSNYVSEKAATRMTIPELLGHYDPKAEQDNAVTARLRKLSQGHPVIVFNKDKTVNVVASTRMMQEINDGFPARVTVMVDSIPHQLYRVGQRLDDLVDENPLYPGRPLRPDGTCDRTGRSWEGVSKGVRQFVRVAVDRGDIQTSVDAAHNLLDILESPTAIGKLSARYPEAFVDFRGKETAGTLPALRVPVTGIDRKGNDPFKPGKTY